MAKLGFRLFGAFQAYANDNALASFRTLKTQALLIYLVTEPPGPHRREALMTLLWPDLPAEPAQVNLRQIVYQLRHAIPNADRRDSGEQVPFVLSDRYTIGINPDAAFEADVRRFARLTDTVRSHKHSNLVTCGDCREHLAEATSLYREPFLADFYLKDSNEFEEWAQRYRERYRRQQIDALATLAQMALNQSRYSAAQTYAQQQLAIDNLDERAYRQLMEALARNGRRTEALQVYNEAQRLLRVELGMSPSSHTARLAEWIKADSLETAASRPTVVRGYELLDELGAGAVGRVYRALQPGVGREVAIKIIRPRYANHPDFIRRFEAEAQTVARLEHPHIVPLYDYWREPDNAYLVMRWLRGGSLASRLSRETLPPDETVAVVEQIAAALYAAHRRGVVHRDVKTTNILLDEEGNAYLSDFSVAPKVGTGDDPNIGSNSLATISPEEVSGEELSPLTDQYSLAIVAFQMLTGRPPFPMDSTPHALRRQILSEALPPAADIVPGLPAAIDTALRRATAAQPGDRFPDVGALAEALRRALNGGRATRPGVARPAPVAADTKVVANPYKGLRAFEESDAAAFFGRGELVQSLVARLTEDEGASAAGRFLGIVGSSGSGKSSLVKAGLIPALRGGAVAGSADWFITEMTPGRNPLEELAVALRRVAVNPPVDLLEPLRHDEMGLARVLRRVLPSGASEAAPQLLLVVDQFEELFTLTEDSTARQQFIDNLLAALGEEHSRLRVVATLRADFYDRPLEVAGLGGMLRDRTAVVLPMSRDELEQAVIQPAAQVGVGLEPGLPAVMLADAADQPGSLPLLQYALTELFERREDGLMTLATYKAIGGVTGALGRRADEIYNNLSPVGQETARQMFLRLITLGEGVEDTRRRVLRAELEALQIRNDELRITNEEATGKSGQLVEDNSELVGRQESPSSLVTPLDSFGRARLLTFDRDPATRGPTVEVAHEALLREWPRLRGWLDESRADVRMQRLLAAEATDWLAAGRGDGYLLRGSRLDQFAGWLEAPPVSLTADERAFLAASSEARRRRHAEEEIRRQRELDTARRLAETERRRAEEQAGTNVRLRRRAALLAGALVLAGTLAAVALLFARSSDQNAAIAATRAAESNANAALAVENANLAATRQAEAVVEANQRATAEADANTQRDTALSREREALESYSLSLAANARQALDANDQPLALLLALAANTVENPPLDAWRTLLDVAYAPGAMRRFAAGSPVNSVDVSPDGRTAVTGSDDGLIRLWDIDSGDLLATLAGHDNAVAQVVFSPDGRQLLSGGWDYKAILWDVATGDIERELVGHGNVVRSVAFMPGGGRALTGEDSGQLQGELILWDLDNGDILNRFGGELEEVIEGVLSLAVSPDGGRALVGYSKVSAFDTQTAALWDIEAGEVIHFLAGSEQSVNGVAISPDGRLGYGASADANIYVWELESGELVQTLRSHEGIVTKIVASPDGLTALSGALDGEMILWDLAAGQPVARFRDHEDAVWGISYRGNSRAVSGSADGTWRLWDLAGNWRSAQWRDPEAPADHLVQELQISPDGRMLLTESRQRDTGQDSRLTLWNYETGAPLRRLEPVESAVLDIAFMPDSRQAITIHNDGSLSVWDLATGRRLARFGSHAGWGSAVDVSDDGRFAVSGGIDDQVIYQDMATGEIIRRMTGHFEGRGILDVVFLPGDRHAVSSSWDGTLIVWDLATGEQIKRLTGLTGGEGGHLFAPGVGGPAVNQIVAAGGRHLLSTGYDRSLLLWDLETGESVLRFSGHSNPVASVGLTPDGRRALSGAFDDGMILWDTATGEPIRRFPFRRFANGNFLPAIAIHPSGQTALTDDIDGSIIQWQLAEPKPVELIDWIAGNRTLRELTCVERETFRIEPLCVDGSAVPAKNDMLIDARRAVGTLAVASAPGPIVPASDGPPALAPPDRSPRIAALGDNRGELTRGNFDVWLYEGQAGEIITLKMIADKPVADRAMPLDARYEAGVLDTRLYILNPDGTILQRIDDEITTDLRQLSDAHFVAVKLAVDGQYRIEARSTLDDHAGGYTLRIAQREAIWDAELFADYVGHYVEGPWQYDTFIYLDGDRLMQSFDYTGVTGFENIAISETDFISAGDSALTVFTRDETGQVDGYAILVSLIHPVSGQWYYAERVGDLPPEFLEALNANRP